MKNWWLFMILNDFVSKFKGLKKWGVCGFFVFCLGGNNGVCNFRYLFFLWVIIGSWLVCVLFLLDCWRNGLSDGGGLECLGKGKWYGLLFWRYCG